MVQNAFLFAFSFKANKKGAGATFDWTFFNNSKVINFDD